MQESWEESDLKKEIEKKEKRLCQMVQPLLVWYENNARDLPWREVYGSEQRPDPYHVWISEIMLQQTRVEAVKEYYFRFLKKLPGIKQLAEVPEDELMKLWQGLGYYNRARNLQKAAQVIMQKYQGEFPEKYEDILSLPGIGAYTAGAIASIAFGERVPAVDGNVYRIYTRFLEDDEDISKTSEQKRIREDVMKILPENSGEFNQALMDLGATICIPNGQPKCSQCPLAKLCLSEKSGAWQKLPVKPKKKKRRIEEKTIFLFESNGKYLIQKRQEKGLLAGLWEFPSQQAFLSLEQLKDCMEDWDVKLDRIELLGSAKHIFSHIEWRMLGYGIHMLDVPEKFSGDDFFWVSLEQMEREYSIPSAFRYYYEKIKEEEEKSDYTSNT